MDFINGKKWPSDHQWWYSNGNAEFQWSVVNLTNYCNLCNLCLSAYLIHRWLPIRHGGNFVILTSDSIMNESWHTGNKASSTTFIDSLQPMNWCISKAQQSRKAFIEKKGCVSSSKYSKKRIGRLAVSIPTPGYLSVSCVQGLKGLGPRNSQ